MRLDPKELWEIRIPTRGRSNRRKTWKNWFFSEMLERGWDVLNVVPECEIPVWKSLRLPYWTVHDSWKIGAIRDHIVESAQRPLQLVLDDDLLLGRCPGLEQRPPVMRGRRSAWGPNDVEDLIGWMTHMISDRGFSHCSIPASEEYTGVTQGLHRYDLSLPGLCRVRTRGIRVHGYAVEDVKSFKFDGGVDGWEDVHWLIQFLLAGKLNVVNWAWLTTQHSNAKGGCSTFRSPENLEETAQRMAELHPGLVTVVKKATKKAWGGGERTTLKIHWKKIKDQADGRK